jgi:hypothetical protein
MATITVVAGTDTPNAGRTQWNTNDHNINDEVVAATADIATHKASGNTDHDTHNDARYSAVGHAHGDIYYTETEIDAAVVKLTGAQDIAGVKTLTSNPIIKHATSSVELATAAGAPVARVLGTVVGATDMAAYLQAYNINTAQYDDVLRGFPVGGYVDSDLDIYSKGKQLATQEYVQDRIRSTTYAIHFSMKIASLAASTLYSFPNAGSGMSLIVPPLGARIVRMMFALDTTATYLADVISQQDVGLTMPVNANQALALLFSTGADSSGVVYTFSLWQGSAGVATTIPWNITSTTMGLAKLTVGAAINLNATLIIAY